MSRVSLTLLVLMVSVCSCYATIVPICVPRPTTTTVLASLSGLLDLLVRLVPDVANLGLQQIPEDCVTTLVNNLTTILDQATNLTNPVIQAIVGILRGLLGVLSAAV